MNICYISVKNNFDNRETRDTLKSYNIRKSFWQITGKSNILVRPSRTIEYVEAGPSQESFTDLPIPLTYPIRRERQAEARKKEREREREREREVEQRPCQATKTTVSWILTASGVRDELTGLDEESLDVTLAPLPVVHGQTADVAYKAKRG